MKLIQRDDNQFRIINTFMSLKAIDRAQFIFLINAVRNTAEK